jgi:hypothetical protein
MLTIHIELIDEDQKTVIFTAELPGVMRTDVTPLGEDTPSLDRVCLTALARAFMLKRG